MDFFTHFFVGILVSIVTLNEFPLVYLYFAGFMAIFPDFDLLLYPLEKKSKNYYLSHRGGSHSFIVGIIIAAIAALIMTAFLGASFMTAWIIGSLFYGLHISLDLLTTSKIPLIYPLSKRESSIYAERAVNPLLGLYSLFMFHLLLYFVEIRITVHPVFNPVNIFLAIYATYFLYRITCRIIISKKLPENATYIPGLLPFIYYIYEYYEQNGEFTYRLSKKFQLMPLRVLIYERRIAKNSNEHVLFNAAKEISRHYRFFSKWKGILPCFYYNGEHVEVKLYLAESISHKFGYNLTTVFNKHTKQLIKKSDRFSSIKAV